MWYSVCVCVGWGIYHLRSGSALLSACPARSLARSRTTAKAVLAWVDQAKPVVWKTKKKANSKRRGDRVCPMSTAFLVPVGPVGSHPVPYKPKRRAQDAAKFCSRRS
jgi:hypothetical protein